MPAAIVKDVRRCPDLPGIVTSMNRACKDAGLCYNKKVALGEFALRGEHGLA